MRSRDWCWLLLALAPACGEESDDSTPYELELSRNKTAGSGGVHTTGGDGGASGKDTIAGMGGSKAGTGNGGGGAGGGGSTIAGSGGSTVGAGNGGAGGDESTIAGSGGSTAGAGNGGGGAGGDESTTAGAGGVAPLPVGKGTIGYWCGPPASAATKEVYDDIADAGFTLTSNACDGTTYNAVYNKQMLGFAAARGMTSIVADQRVVNAISQANSGQLDLMNAGLDAVVADYAAHPALRGYHVMDEPGASLFPALTKVVGGLKARDPNRISYLNLLPNYASSAQLGVSDYDTYVQNYINQVAPPIVSWDYYPFLLSGDAPGFFENLAVVRKHSLAKKVPFWQFVQAISFVGHRATTEAEKRWVALQSLAYGATGIWYFTYWTPPQTAENFGHGIVAPDGAKTEQYAEIKGINRTFAIISKYLVPATSRSVHHEGPLELGAEPRIPGSPVYIPSFAKVTVGVFDVPGHTYILLANRDYKSNQEVDFIVPDTPKSIEILDMKKEIFVSTNTQVVSDGVRGHVSLAPGDGALLHLLGTVIHGPKGAEAVLGLVRADSGYQYLVDSAWGVGALRPAGWDLCPTGYTWMGHDFQSNGFWFCARADLADTTYYVGSVVADQGTLFEVVKGGVKSMGPGGWDECPNGAKLIGKRFDSNGFWVCH